MKCSRCHGFMVRDHILDVLDTEIHSEVWRCICCGNIMDPIILANRSRKETKTRVGAGVRSLARIAAA